MDNILRTIMSQTLLDKVWAAHAVRTLPNGSTQLLIGTHLIHEVTSPQAFGMLGDLGLKVLYPSRTFATVDHIVPTDERQALARLYAKAGILEQREITKSERDLIECEQRHPDVHPNTSGAGADKYMGCPEGSPVL